VLEVGHCQVYFCHPPNLHCRRSMELQCHASRQTSLKACQKQMTVQNKSKSRKAVLLLHILVLVPVFLSEVNETVPFQYFPSVRRVRKFRQATSYNVVWYAFVSVTPVFAVNSYGQIPHYFPRLNLYKSGQERTSRLVSNRSCFSLSIARFFAASFFSTLSL
jgi:hypothetical protein